MAALTQDELLNVIRAARLAGAQVIDFFCDRTVVVSQGEDFTLFHCGHAVRDITPLSCPTCGGDSTRWIVERLMTQLHAVKDTAQVRNGVSQQS